MVNRTCLTHKNKPHWFLCIKQAFFHYYFPSKSIFASLKTNFCWMLREIIEGKEVFVSSLYFCKTINASFKLGGFLLLFFLQK